MSLDFIEILGLVGVGISIILIILGLGLLTGLCEIIFKKILD